MNPSPKMLPTLPLTSQEGLDASAKNQLLVGQPGKGIRLLARL